MAKYTSDASLIKGAGKAYRNLDNVGGMYAGLDKVIEVGTEMYETAVKKAEEEKAKKEAIEKSWNESADKVLLNAGALGDTIYNSTTEDVKKLKELYLEGVNEKDDTKRMSALRGLQSHSTWVQDHKQTNLDYAEAKKNGELSSYYKDNEKGREEAHVIDQIMGQKYKKTSRADEDDDVMFHVTDLAGNEKLVSSKQYNDMVLPKNYTISDSLEKNLIEAKKSEILDENTVRQKIKKSLPNDERDFVAGMYDDVSGKNLIEMLKTSETLDQEIINAVDPSAWDTDPEGTPGVLDPSEKANFIDAVTNPGNDFFNLENSKQIMEDQLFNGIKNKHTNHWEKINSKLDKGKETTGLNLSYGHRTWGQMKDEYDLIGTGKEGDRISVSQGDVKTVLVRNKEGGWANTGDATQVFTPNQVKQMKEFNHLDDFEEAEITDPTMEAPIGESGFKYKDYKQIDGEWFFTKDGKSEKVMSSATKDQLNQIYVPK